MADPNLTGEQRLEIVNLLEDKLKSFQTFIDLINLLSQTISMIVEKQILVLLSKFSSNFALKTQEQVAQLLQHIGVLLKRQETKREVKTPLIKILIHFMSFPLQDQNHEMIRFLRQQVKTQIDQDLSLVFQQSISSDHAQNSKVSFAVVFLLDLMYVYLQSSNDIMSMSQIVEFELGMLLRLWDSLIQSLFFQLSGNAFNHAQISQDPDGSTAAACAAYLLVFETFSKLLSKVLQHYVNHTHQSQSQIVQPLVVILQQLMLLRIGNLGHQKENLLFRPTPHSLLNAKLHYIKNKGVQSVIMLHKLVARAKESKDQTLVALSPCISIMISSLLSFFRREDTDIKQLLKLSFSEQYSKSAQDVFISLLRRCIKYLSIAAKEFVFFETFSSRQRELLFELICPCLVASEKEHEDAADNPTEFVHFQMNLVSSDSSVTVKQAMLRFLKGLSLYVDGIIKVAFETLVEMMSFTLEDGQVPVESFKYLSRILQTKYITKTNTEDKLESALLILTALVSKFS